ncbi:MAG: cupin domain-containing protein [Elusimicrobia bacterium]|nr:cupin domain-containing protein [Elusimicrobiota bacterium]
MVETNQSRQDLGEPAVQNLSHLIDYQQGSIVSRQIINKKTGTATLFAFDFGESLSEHIAPYDALVYLVDGSAEIIISQKSFRVQKGEMIIMPANQPHAVKALERFKMFLTMIRS